MIIYLNGTSSSGKTTIAKGIQDLATRPVIYFSVDNLLYSLPPKDLQAIQGLIPYRARIDWSAIFAGYIYCLQALHTSGNDVIGDCPVYTTEMNNLFQSTMAPIQDKIIVGIDCPLDTLLIREQQRGDRAIGIAAKQHKTIHSFLNYDLRLDSGDTSPLDSAKLIVAALQKKGQGLSFS